MKILDRIPRFLTSAVVTAGVLYLTLAPRPFGSVRIPLFEGADKVVHFMMFFAMAFAYHFDFRVARSRSTKRVLWAGYLSASRLSAD